MKFSFVQGSGNAEERKASLLTTKDQELLLKENLDILRIQV